MMTSTDLQFPSLEQAHEVCGGVKHVCEHSTLLLTIISGMTNKTLKTIVLDLTLKVHTTRGNKGINL